MAKIDEYEFPDELHYTVWHTWAKIDGNVAKLGLTSFGQRIAGEITTFRARRAGAKIAAGKAFATIETAKWVGAMKSPLSGTITEVNPKLAENPTLVNSDPYGEGWMIILQPEKLEEELGSILHGEKMVERYKADIEGYKATGKFEMPP